MWVFPEVGSEVLPLCNCIISWSDLQWTCGMP